MLFHFENLFLWAYDLKLHSFDEILLYIIIACPRKKPKDTEKQQLLIVDY